MKKLKKTGWIILAVLVLVLITQFATSYILKKQLYQKLNVENNIDLTFKDVSFNIFTGSVSLDSLTFIRPDSTKVYNYALEAKNAFISDFHYINYLNDDKIVLGALVLDQPKISIFKNRKSQEKDSVSGITTSFNLKNISITNGELLYFENDTLEPKFQAKHIHTDIKGIKAPINRNILKRIPENYESIAFSAKEIYFPISDFEKLTMKHFSIKNNNAIIDSARVKTIYAERELSQKIPYEKDYVDLHIKEVKVNDWSINQVEGHSLLLVNDVAIHKAQLRLFRDKAVADRENYNSLYNEKLDQLNFQISFPKIEVTDSEVSYEELAEGSEVPGKIYFNKLKAKLNISNVEEKSQRIIGNATALFMGKSPVALNTTLDAYNRFSAKGTVSDFDAALVDQYLEQNLHTHVTGVIEQINFEMNGADDTANGKVAMKYDDFEVEIMKKDALRVNKILSALGNFIINRNKDIDPEGFRHGEFTTERDKTKSFFNFLWLSLRDGIIDTLTSKNNASDHGKNA